MTCISDFLDKMCLWAEPNNFLPSLLPSIYFTLWLLAYHLYALSHVLRYWHVRGRVTHSSEKVQNRRLGTSTLERVQFGDPSDSKESKLNRIMEATSWTRRLIPSMLATWAGLQITGVVSFEHLGGLGQYKRQSTNSSGLLDVFQVNKPVFTPPAGSDFNGNCVSEVLLMDYVFGFSYGMPFVGNVSCPPWLSSSNNFQVLTRRQVAISTV